MYDYLILKQLSKYTKANKGFHMPGHKARGEFKSKFPVADIDVTELSWSDNLACPTGIIAAAQRDVAAILGARHSFILTDGSSSGVLTMLYAASKRGNKIIVPRNAHQSVWNGCRIFGLEPVIVQGKNSDGLLTPADVETIEQLIVNDVNISGMIVTSPDYYGLIAPLKEYSEVLHKNGRLLLVDGAHGGHLAFEPERKGYAGVYADIWVDGVHKSLPALTQGAILNLNDESLSDAVVDGLSIFRTTSPSYPIMASVEYAVKFIANNTDLYMKAKAAAATFDSGKEVYVYPTDDWTKLVIDCAPNGVSSHTVADMLERKGIYPELSDGRFLVFYLSPMTTASDINDLKNRLVAIMNSKKLPNDYKSRPAYPSSPRTYSFQYALKRPAEWVDLDHAVGRMCAQNAGLTPPCIPVIAVGEMISDAAAAALKTGKTYGTKDGKVKVVKK